jgi:predicted AAA+ superfamily ATPase
MITRILEQALRTAPKSVLLLGPRQVGKSTLLAKLKPELTINLADEEQLFRFAGNPGELRTQLETHEPQSIFIDEIQRLPSLLNTIQAVIDRKKGPRFLLSGSSARKLRRGNANLLPGRILPYQLGPLILGELPKEVNVAAVLRYGLLPEIYLERDTATKQQLLLAYANSYLSEEIKAEALVRNLEAFTRFLRIATECSGQFVDYSKFAQRAKISRHSFSRFYEIFEDTLVGQRVWPFAPLAEDADLVKHPKFFLFDTGVYNAILGNFASSPDRIGVLAEHLVHNQLLHSAWAACEPVRLSTFRTRGGLEVDFILELRGDVIAIEVKTSDHLNASEVASLKAFKEYYPKAHDLMVIHLGTESKKISGVWCHPLGRALRELGLA